MLNNENYGYLVHPLTQFMDDNLKPLTSAYLKVFYAGTSASAYTYSDWEGTLNPSDIMLSMNGSANVIAEKNKAYKVMLCDALHPPSNPIWVKDNLYVISSEIEVISSTQGLVPLTITPVIVDTTATLTIEQGGFASIDLTSETTLTAVSVVLTNTSGVVMPVWWFKIKAGSDVTLSVEIGGVAVGWLGSAITNIELGKTVEINVVDGVACGGEMI